MRIAIVTGASAGIGREFVRAIDREGAYEEIWVIARRTERLEELKKECRTPLRPVTLDLAAEESLTRYRELLEKERPEIGLLVNASML